MALFRRFFYRKPPDRLLEISERVYVFDCCFSTNVLEEDEYKVYMGGIVAQLQDHYPDASFMVFNFREGERRSQISDILSHYDMTVMEYPRHYEGCPLLPLEMIHHFLRSSESWLSLEGQQNVLLMHCERGGWPVLAFMLAGLLLYRKQYSGEQKTLEMIYKQAPRELLHHLSPLNPQPSQLRYLQYISRRNLGSDWPPSDMPLALNRIILRVFPLFDGGKGCRPVIRVYGQDHSSSTATRSSKLLFSTSKKKKSPHLCRQEECELVKIDIRCRVQGDVILECIHLDDDLVREEMIFRVVFHTAFVQSNVLMLNRDEIDVLWGMKDQFPKDFKAEVLFSDADAVPCITTTEMASEDGNETESASPEEFFEVEEIFSSAVDGQDGKGYLDSHVVHEENYKVVRKEVLETHPCQDSALDDGNRKCDGKGDAKSGVVKAFAFDDWDGSESTVMISDVPSRVENVVVAADMSCKLEEMEGRQDRDNSAMQNSLEKQDPWQHVSVEPMVAAAVVSDKLEEMEKRLDREDTTLQNNLESQALQQKLSANINRKKSEKSLPLAQKKQPSSSAKPAADLTATKQKFKHPEPQGTFARQAKPNAVSRWIPSNKGSYTNSMHVYYPPSARYNTPPPAPVHAKDPHPGGKSKATAASGAVVETDKIPKSVSHAVDYVRSANDEPVKHTSCSPFMDITPLQATNPPSSTSPTLHQVSLKVPPPPPPPPPLSLKKTSNVLSSQDPAILPQSVARLASPSPTISPLMRLPPPPSSGILLNNSSKSSLQSDSTMQMQAKTPPPTLPPPPPPHSPSTRNAFFLTSLPLTLVPPLPPTLPVLNISHTSKQDGVEVSTPPPQPPPPPPPPPCFPAHGVPTSPPVPPPPLSAPPPPPPLPPRHGTPPPPPPTPSRGAPPPPRPIHEAPSLPPVVGQSPMPPSLGGALPPPPLPGGRPLGSPPPPGPPRPPSGAPPPPPPFGSKGPGAGVPPPPPGKWHGLSRPTALALATRRSNLKPLHWSKVTRALQGSLWEEFQRHGEPQIAPEFDVSELETLFSATVPKSDPGSKSGGHRKSVESKTDKVHLIDLRRANNTEIMLTKVKMPLPDMMAAALAMDESILDADQVENLIKFCPTKEEMDLLKGYTGDKENLGKCEQFFLELMKVPRVESKLRVFLFKIQFNSQISDFKRSLSTVNAACVEVRNSLKLKEIMKKILYLGNTLNQGTARGSAVGFKLDSLLKLTDTRASNSKMTLMHYLCKVLSFKSPTLLDFHEDLISLDAASKIQLKSLAEEMQAIIKGLEKVKQELVASENDGPVSEVFHQTSKEFIGTAEAEVASVMNLYSVVGKNADALALYFGEDPSRCPFEQVTATLLNFVRLFRKAHEENCKQAELEKKKAEKEAETEKAKGINLTKKSEN